MKQKIIKIKVCPECGSCKIKKDENTTEIFCSKCGLVIIAPPTMDYVTDGYKVMEIKLIVNPELLIINGGEASEDNKK